VDAWEDMLAITAAALVLAAMAAGTLIALDRRRVALHAAAADVPSGRRPVSGSALAMVASVSAFAVALVVPVAPALAAFPGSDGLIAYGVWATPERV
jgi:hypothetical protein